MSLRIRTSGVKTLRHRLEGEAALGYAGGLMDGEGCIHIAKANHRGARRGYTLRLVVTIAQNDLKTLVHFQHCVGLEGLLYQRSNNRTENRDGYALIYNGSAGEAVLELLLPYLIRKRREAEVALEFQRTCHLSTHFGPKGCPDEIWARRESFRNKLQNLK